ncbi:MAG: CusA/CzcA family heavy metal efflux RND transporter [Syntrophaceae bacterium]|nr:CusA/CzcA family heavy metal efflux RND transporter [Syntrophaceae bacterium]
MNNYLIKCVLRYRWMVVGLAMVIMGSGVFAYNHLPIDAYPDISPPTVTVMTEFPGRAPEEIERQVAIPIEIAMRSVPKVETIRLQTIFGLSCVDLVFEEGTNIWWARQQVGEKLKGVELPEESGTPKIAAAGTPSGEIYRYTLVSDGSHDVMDLQAINNWVVIPRLLQLPGVAEVSNFGGLTKQYAITFKPSQLQRYGLTLADVVDAVQANNSSAGGSVLRRGSMDFVIRSGGYIESAGQIGDIFVKSINGTPIYVKDIATVGIDAAVPWSVYSKDHIDETVQGIVLMYRGENPSLVLNNVRAAVESLNASPRMEGVTIAAFYDRQFLVDNTLWTVSHSISMGITLVVLILLLFLGRPAMALLVALTIPFAFLFALVMMYLTDIPIGLLSIGAIDFGIIVDGSVIMAESIARRLAESRRRDPKGTFAVIRETAIDMFKPIFVSVSLIMVAFLPLLTLTRIEGLLFRPMAMTILYALGGGLIFALFIVPVLASFFFRRGYEEWENPVLLWVKPAYASIVRLFLRARVLVATLAIAGLVLALFHLVPRLGVEFLPYMDEGTIWIKANFPSGTALEQTAAFGKEIRQIVLEHPDIEFISMQIGRADAFSEPFPCNRIEMLVGPKPRDLRTQEPRALWTQARTKHEIIAALKKRLREEFPTTRFAFTQPLLDNVMQYTNGTSAQLGVEISGDDFDVLLALATQTVELLQGIPGSEDVSIEQEGPQAQLQIIPNRQLCARYNVRIEDVTQLINTAMGGDPIGALYEGNRRFDIVAKLDRKAVASSPQAIGQLSVPTVTDGAPIPLAQVTKIEIIDGQTLITRSNGRRCLVIRCGIAGRDEGGFVAEAQARIAREIMMPTGYEVEWLGMYQNLDRAYRHFLLIMPATIGIVFFLLVVSFGSLRAGLVLLLPVPFALAAGALALYLRGMNMNVSTGVGFVTLFGLSVMDGILMLKEINRQRLAGLSIDEAIIQGRLNIMRPSLMASLVAILGLLPASLATTLGSDVQRPLATVIVWGLSGSTLFTQFVSPVFYRLFVPPLPRPEEEDEENLEETREPGKNVV